VIYHHRSLVLYYTHFDLVRIQPIIDSSSVELGSGEGAVASGAVEVQQSWRFIDRGWEV
jgi:hypothetical protein